VRPGVPETLGLLAQSLVGELGLRMPEGYERESARFSGAILALAAEEWDRAAARRVEENAAMRAIFADAAPIVSERALARRLRAAAKQKGSGLRISELDRENDALRALLIELHARVEELDSEGAREIERRVWAELATSTRRRALSIAPF
jgi:hypothetical protein